MFCDEHAHAYFQVSHTRSVIDACTSAVAVTPVIVLCVGECEQLLYKQGLICDKVALVLPLVAYISFLEHKVQKQAPASLDYLHQRPKGLPSFPISSIPTQHHLFEILYQLGWHLPQAS